MSSDGAALVAAAVRAACQCNASRRTIASIAAAVASVAIRSPTGSALAGNGKASGVRFAESKSAEKCDAKTGNSPVQGDVSEAKRCARRRRRLRQRENRRAVRANGSTGGADDSKENLDEVSSVSSGPWVAYNAAPERKMDVGDVIVGDGGSSDLVTGVRRALDRDGLQAASPPGKVQAVREQLDNNEMQLDRSLPEVPAMPVSLTPKVSLANPASQSTTHGFNPHASRGKPKGRGGRK